jgi:uncharacterized membrane protein (UPF0127 family)
VLVLLAVAAGSVRAAAPAPGAAEEARHLVAERGDAVWPGWRSAGPLGGTAGAATPAAVQALAERAFSARLRASRGGVAPPLERPAGEPAAQRAIRALPGGEAALAREGAALAAAREAASVAASRRAAAAVARLRATRQVRLPPGVVALERRREWELGLQRYAGTRLVLEAAAEGYQPLAGISYPSAAATRADFLRRLTAERAPTSLGGRWRLLGAAQGLVLDRLLAGWRQRAAAGAALDRLVAEAVDVPDLLAGFRATRVTLGGKALRVALAEEPGQWGRGLMGVRSVAPLDGMLFAFPSDSHSGFWMKNTLIPLDIAFFTAAGELVGVRTMVPCTEEPCPTYGVDGAYRFALEVPAGRLEGLPASVRLRVPRP